MEENKKLPNANQKRNLISDLDNHDLISLLQEKSLIDDSTKLKLSQAKEFIVSTYIDVPMYRPLPVKMFGVLNNKDFATPESKYWQCKVEAEVHANELIREIHSLELGYIELEKINVYMDKNKDAQTDDRISDYDKRLLQLDLKELNVQYSKKMFELKQLEKRIKYRIEEVSEWKIISDKLLEKHENSINPHDFVKSYVNNMVEKLKREAEDPDNNNDKNALLERAKNIEQVINSIS